MPTPTLLKWFARAPSAAPRPTLDPASKPRSALRIGIPRVLNLWSTHQFWIGFFDALGVDARKLEFPPTAQEDQARQFGKGRGTVDCCYPVKCINGHYGELLARAKHHKIDVLFSADDLLAAVLPEGHVLESLACPRVMAAPENTKAGLPQGKGCLRGARCPPRGAAGVIGRRAARTESSSSRACARCFPVSH
jgi:hypothetical protein